LADAAECAAQKGWRDRAAAADFAAGCHPPAVCRIKRKNVTTFAKESGCRFFFVKDPAPICSRNNSGA
jgi:hypothetical protein